MNRPLALAIALAASQAAFATPLEDALRVAIDRAAAGAPGRIEVEFPEYQTPPALAGCTRPEPFMPPGIRPWGRSQIGVRCMDPGNLVSGLVPVVIHAYVEGLVATRALPSGTVLGAEDLAPAEIDLTASGAGTPILDANLAVGRTVGRPIPAGAPLRTDLLRPKMAIAAGDAVRILYTGPGFSVSADGKALAGAQDGQPVRVQTESGRVLTGTARGGRVVELRSPAGT